MCSMQLPSQLSLRSKKLDLGERGQVYYLIFSVKIENEYRGELVFLPYFRFVKMGEVQVGVGSNPVKGIAERAGIPLA